MTLEARRRFRLFNARTPRSRGGAGRWVDSGPSRGVARVVPSGWMTPPTAMQKTTVNETDPGEIAADLARNIRGAVRFGRHDRMLYATDASLYQVEPIGVVVPADIEDAVAVVSICAGRGVPILPRGGGTSLAGQCVNHAVVIDFSAHCRTVHDVDTSSRTVRVEPGVCLDELNEEIARRGHRLFFAPDVATSRHANIGGMIGNNSAGARSVRYGRTVEHVAAIDAMLLDDPRRPHRATLSPGASLRDDRVARIAGRVADVINKHERGIRERFPKIARNSSGYLLDLILNQLDESGGSAERLNLAALVCGSEGTLAVTLGAELKLSPVPTARGLAIVSFDSVRDAIEAVNPILGTSPSAVELLDDMVIALARNNTEHRGAVDMLPRSGSVDPRAALYVEYSADSDAREIADSFAALARAVPGRSSATFTEPGAMARAWALRKAAEPLLHGLPGLRKPITFVEDTAVAPERLPEFVERFRAIVEAHGTSAAFYAHASVGCLHVRPLLDPHDPGDRDRLRAISVAVADLVMEFGGTMSGEHGDGRVRGPLLERAYGAEIVGAFHEIKSIFDPAGLLNPGNIVAPGPVESITARLRVLPSDKPVRVPDVETFFDYSDQHGFAGAVEMCNGAGVCRKKTGGTMCPSYRATLDERHATRGRGNALRLAISGQFNTGGSDAPSWDDADTISTLELCLSCKACKSECPSNVDIARLKAEYTAQRYRAGSAPPVRDLVFARVRELNRLGSIAPRLANAAQRIAPIRAMMNRALGLAPGRSLPKFEKGLVSRLKRKGVTPVSLGGEAARLSEHRAPATVALVADCFTGFGESDIGVAAVRALEAVGAHVRVIDAGCCQRPAISLGQLDRAQRCGARFVDALAPLAVDETIAKILFLEPSCLSAAIDDLPSLLHGVRAGADRAARLAARCMLVDDYLSDWLGAINPDADAIEPTGPPVIFHGHCHQKALLGNGSSVALLRRLVGDRLRVLDAGCCGMAGAFGMTRERFELSMKIGELVLLPAAREAPADAIIVATGSSCRHQIHDGAGRVAIHPVQLAEAILRG